MDELLGCQDLGNKEFWEVGYDFLRSMSGMKDVDLVYFNQQQEQGTDMTNRSPPDKIFGNRVYEDFKQSPGLDISQMMNDLGGQKRPSYKPGLNNEHEAQRRIQDLATGRASQPTGRVGNETPFNEGGNILKDLNSDPRGNHQVNKPVPQDRDTSPMNQGITPRREQDLSPPPPPITPAGTEIGNKN